MRIISASNASINEGQLNNFIQRAAVEKLKKEMEAKKGKLDMSSNFNLAVDLMDFYKIGNPPNSATVTMTTEVFSKVRSLVLGCTNEIAWHGVVERTGPADFLIKDILVYPQHVTGATVESADEYGNWLHAHEDEVFNNLRYQGHSHVRMATSPSGVDTNLYATYLESAPEYYIFHITNYNDTSWFEIHMPEFNIIYENKDIKFITPNQDVWAKEQIAKYLIPKPARVIPPSVTPPATTSFGHHGYDRPTYNQLANQRQIDWYDRTY